VPESERTDGLTVALAYAADIEDQRIAEDIRQVLSDRHEATGIDIETPLQSPFAPEVQYQRSNEVNDREFRSAWSEFETTLKTKARYFSPTAESILSSIFKDLHLQQTAEGQGVIVTGGPGTALSALYRARTVQTVAKLRTALSRPDKEVGPPPAFAATGGRMNARGISVFYGATDQETVIAEVRPPVGRQVLVGRFELIRPARLLDLNALAAVNIAAGSIFDSEYTHCLKRARFLAC
jgi:hypothetical protein